MSFPRLINKNFRTKSNSSAFADDCNVFFNLDLVALSKCKEILDRFYLLTGLKINVNKTKLCIVGGNPSAEFTNLVNELGFEIVDEFKMLGFLFDKNLSLLAHLIIT